MSRVVQFSDGFVIATFFDGDIIECDFRSAQFHRGRKALARLGRQQYHQTAPLSDLFIKVDWAGTDSDGPYGTLVTVRSVSTGRRWSFDTEVGPIHTCSIDGERIFIGGDRSEARQDWIECWDLEAGLNSWRIDLPEGEEIRNRMQASLDGKFLLVHTSSNSPRRHGILILDLSVTRWVAAFSMPSEMGWSPRMQLTRDSQKLLVWGKSNHGLRVVHYSVNGL